MVYPQSLRKEEPKMINQKQSDNAKDRWQNNPTWNNKKVSEEVTKRILKPKRSTLFYYIGYIYLPVGFLVLMPSFIFLNQTVVMGATALWAIGYFILVKIDEKGGIRWNKK